MWLDAVPLDQTMTPRSANDEVPGLAVRQSPHKQSIDLESLFMASQDEPDAPKRGQSLQGLCDLTEPNRLEAGVRAGVHMLSELAAPLKELTDSEDAKAWLEQLESVKKLAVATRTVVGVVGNTGAGKSSVINAMLDEERLVPSNCMRACTAVVTEISYNDSQKESSKYRAEIEFIQAEDWRKELELVFKEAFDEEGKLVREATNPDTEAGVA